MKVLSIEQMTKLKELGIDVKPKGACLMYTSDSSDNYYLKYGESTCEDDVAAFGLQDIIELLPESIKVNSYIYNLSIDYYANEFIIHYTYDYEPFIQFDNNSILQAVYDMLLWVAKKRLFKNKVIWKFIE